MLPISQPGKGAVLRVPVPKTRDPFINTPLLPLGVGADGEERFWISSWNSVSGTTGLLVRETGKERVYRFEPPHFGFYSAAQEDDDTLWLCGDLSRVVRLTLSTGEFTTYETGAPPALVFRGMIIDHDTGKLYAAAFPSPKTAAFSFDYRNRKPVKVYEDIGDERFMRCHFSNGDGTYSSVMTTPGLSLLQWNPHHETLKRVILHEQIPDFTLPISAHYEIDGSVPGAEGEWYFPHYGWYNPRTRQLAPGPHPEREMTWIARRGNRIWGVGGEESDKMVGIWDIETGRVKKVCTLSNAGGSYSAALTAQGKIVCVSVYGEFSRYDASTGVLELTRRLSTDSVTAVDCLRRIDKDRLLGTSFITQRFWEVNLRTGEGFDCGRAAPGNGEVLQTWRVGGKIYMAAYTGGELTEYDPAWHPHFPENPRVVAKPPGGMRPVAAADDGRRIYYSCNRIYGHTGCVVTRYDTETGLAVYFPDPIAGQAIRSLIFDDDQQTLLAGTTMLADGNSAAEVASHCLFVRLKANDFQVLDQQPAPESTEIANVRGALGKGRYLCEVLGVFAGDFHWRWFVLSLDDFRVPGIEGTQRYPEGMEQIVYTGRAGLFVLLMENQVELWNLNQWRCVAVLHEREGAYHVFIDEDSVFLVKHKEIIVLEDSLAAF